MEKFFGDSRFRRRLCLFTKNCWTLEQFLWGMCFENIYVASAKFLSPVVFLLLLKMFSKSVISQKKSVFRWNLANPSYANFHRNMLVFCDITDFENHFSPTTRSQRNLKFLLGLHTVDTSLITPTHSENPNLRKIGGGLINSNLGCSYQLYGEYAQKNFSRFARIVHM